MNASLWIAAVLICLSISTAQAVVFPVQPSANGRYLVDQQGQPFFYHGDTPWMACRLTRAEALVYLDDRRAKGFNVVQIMALWPGLFLTSTTGLRVSDVTVARNREGHLPFTGEPLATPNPLYFDFLAWFVARAAERGMLVALAPAWQGANHTAWWKYYTVARCQKYGQYLGQRFAGFNNILWIHGGDSNPDGKQDSIRALANEIRKYAPRQPHTYHGAPETSSATHFAGDAWLTVNGAYTYAPAHQHVSAAYSRSPVRPIPLLETRYEDMLDGTSAVIRRQAYYSVLSGACGHAYGHATIFTFNPGWQTALQRPGAQHMVQLKKLFTSVAWHRLVPDLGHQTVTAGYGSGTSYVPSARADDGSFVLAYVPPTGSSGITVNLSRISGSVAAQWFNPTNGSYSTISGSPFANSGSRVFTTPGSNGAGGSDWVLVLKATTAPTPTPTNTPPSVSITGPANGSTFTAPASITVSANASDSNGINRVEFLRNGAVIGSDTTSPYSLAMNSVAAGSYSLAARAVDNLGTASTSGAVTITVRAAPVANTPPAVALTGPANGSTFTAPASITVSANASDSNGTVSRVEFLRNGAVIGTDTTSPYSFVMNNVALGSYSLAARAVDNAGAATTSGAVTITVKSATVGNTPPAVTLTGPVNGSTYTAPANITVSAHASDSNGINRVEFLRNGAVIGSDTTSPYSLAMNSVAAGSYSLAARAVDNLGASTTSGAVTITVRAAPVANAPPAVALTGPANGSTFTAPASITVSANASDSNGINRVEFLRNGAVIGSDTTSPYSLVMNSVAAGSYSLAARAVDNLGSISSSNTVNVTVTGVTPPTGSQTNASTFISQSVPATMTAGSTYPVSVTMRNSGTKTWTAAGMYRLGSQNAQDNVRWGLHRVALAAGDAIAAGQSKTFTFNVKAPTTAGTYNFQWRMVQDGVMWFGGLSANVAVKVNAQAGTSLPSVIIVDNRDANTSKMGTWAVSDRTGGWNTDSLFSNSNPALFRWIPRVPVSGSYQVYARWTQRGSRATNVPYRITHASGTATVRVNQQVAGSQWNLLGTYRFNVGSGGYVVVSGENGQACADAIRLVMAAPVGTG